LQRFRKDRISFSQDWCCGSVYRKTIFYKKDSLYQNEHVFEQWIFHSNQTIFPELADWELRLINDVWDGLPPIKNLHKKID